SRLEHAVQSELRSRLPVPARDAVEQPSPRGFDLRRALPDVPLQLDAPQLFADPEREIGDAAGVHAEAFVDIGRVDPRSRRPAVTGEGTDGTDTQELVGDHGMPRFHCRKARSSFSFAFSGTSLSRSRPAARSVSRICCR